MNAGMQQKRNKISEGTKITKNCGFLIFKNLLDFKITYENFKKYKKIKNLSMIFLGGRIVTKIQFNA
ncbi:MAG: hypothetical protein BWK75_06490 [Candidatus Altiarchaeales archaeon A3]|nr:MAG: hypothetical protein BWK75_06490 [Candidatus Altiarchaeales archaeon A3]